MRLLHNSAHASPSVPRFIVYVCEVFVQPVFAHTGCEWELRLLCNNCAGFSSGYCALDVQRDDMVSESLHGCQSCRMRFIMYEIIVKAPGGK